MTQEAQTDDPTTSEPNAVTSKLPPAILALVGVGAALLSIPLGIGSLAAPSPGMWPLLVGLLTFATALWLVFRDNPDDYDPWTLKSLQILLGIGSLVLFILLFSVVGFTISAIFLLVVWLRFFARESWRVTVIASIVGSVALAVIFGVLLGVPFPNDPILGVLQ